MNKFRYGTRVSVKGWDPLEDYYIASEDQGGPDVFVSRGNDRQYIQFSMKRELVSLYVAPTVFNEQEMYILKAIFAGNCCANRLGEGGDYTYRIWNNGMTQEEMDAFLEKLEI